MKIEIKGEFLKALEAINRDFYKYDDLSLVVEELIDEYLLREGGRLGKIEDGKFIE